jgi:hypothetical protein
VKRELTDLGRRVDRFIQECSDRPSSDIGLLLLKLLRDEDAARKFGLMESPKRGRPPEQKQATKHRHIASDYLIELHRLGGRGKRGAAKEAKANICNTHRIDERQIDRYLKEHRTGAYVIYRLAVNDPACKLSGEPDMPSDVIAEIDRLLADVDAIRKRRQ